MKSETPRTDELRDRYNAELICGLEILESHAEIERELNAAKIHCADANKGARINAMVNASLTKQLLELKERMAAMPNVEVSDGGDKTR